MLYEHNGEHSDGVVIRLEDVQLAITESEHQLVTALSVESWPEVLQMVQKHIIG